MTTRSLLPEDQPIVLVDVNTEGRHGELPVVATRDHELIRRWAAKRSAEPATGEATDSGPSTVVVTDGDAGIRFNFPGVSRFRPISWDEWFQNFSQHDLTFVYERDGDSRTPSARYRLVPMSKLTHVADVR